MASENLLVPSGSTPAIDGTITDGEWDGAAVEAFSDGSELLLIYADGDLYLGIRSNTPDMIATNVFVNRGDEIAIMHSSAALGTAIYQRSGDQWEKTQDFNWQCRDSSSSDSAKAARAKFLQQEGWLANISYMGNPEEVEYRIELSEDVLRVAVNFLRASNLSEKIPWPINLDDDCIKPTPGGYPDSLSFSPDQWVTLEFSR